MVEWIYPNKEVVLENRHIKAYLTDIKRDAKSLYDAASIQSNGKDIFEYFLSAGPFEKYSDFQDYLEKKVSQNNSLTFTIFSKRLNKVVGNTSLLNINSAHGSAEIGSIWYCVEAQRSEVNTNTMYLFMSYIFDDLRYRRLEWKCHNDNESSKNAAVRLGFQLEGIFRQHFWNKGKNRDTVWYSIIDSEWPEIKKIFNDQLLD